MFRMVINNTKNIIHIVRELCTDEIRCWTWDKGEQKHKLES